MKQKYNFLLPAYKPDFFREALDSILGQTYKDFKLIILDDCSPYDLKSIVDEYADPRISYSRNEVNMGGKSLVSCWNKLLGMADSDYIILASDDDVYEKNFLMEVDKLAEKYPVVDLIRVRVRRINEAGEVIADDAIYKEYGDCVDYLYQKHFNNGITCMPCFVFKTQALRKVGGFVDLPEAWHSDDASSIIVSENGVANSILPLLNFRTSSVNISGKTITPKSAFEKCKATILYDQFFHNFLEKIKKSNNFTAYKKRQIQFAEKHHDDFCYIMSRTYASLCSFSDFLRILTCLPLKERLKFFLYCFKMKLFH